MADTVKKSRIVSDTECLATFSDEDASLQDIINEEFNQRLKTCMRDDDFLEPNAEHIALTYESGDVLKNGSQKQQTHQDDLIQNTAEKESATVLKDIVTPVLKQDTETSISPKESPTKLNGNQTPIPQEDIPQTVEESSTNGLKHSEKQETSPEDSFVNKEIPSPEEDIESPFDNVTVTDVDNENLTAKERFLSTVKDIEEENKQTIKDRMLLSTDSACLLFTQTVVQSPMLTPTDETYDFLQGLRQTSSTEQVSPVKIVDILENLAVKPENTEQEEDVSEISAENEVCVQIESSNSEDLSESLKVEIENDENQEDIKLITSNFLQNEISEVDGEVSAAKTALSAKRSVFKSTPTIVEHLVDDIDPENDEIIEDYSIQHEDVQTVNEPVQTVNEPVETVNEPVQTVNEPSKKIVCGVKEVYLIKSSNFPVENSSEYEERSSGRKYEVTSSEVIYLIDLKKAKRPKISAELDQNNESASQIEEIEESLPKNEDVSTKSEESASNVNESPATSPSKVSEISKIFSPKDSEDLKEEPKSPVLEETFEDMNKTKEIFEKMTSDSEGVLKSSETSKMSKNSEDLKEEMMEATFENIKKTKEIFEKMTSDSEGVLKSSENFTSKDTEELKSPIMEATFEDIKKTKEIFEKKSSESHEISHIFTSKDFEEKNEELKSPVLEATFEDIKKTKEIFEKISSESEETAKSCDLIKRLNESSSPGFDSDSFTNTVCHNISTTTMSSESSFVETRTEVNSNQDKVLKKKKSKKSKKDNEKENISVCDTNFNEEDNLSHVSVKNLCRSFSDLSSLGNKNLETRINKNRAVYGRTKSMSDIRREDMTLENVFTNVSVKSLKSSFSKFDALQKKSVLHVRSSDSGKAQEKFNGNGQIDTSSCKSCNKQVFQMEQIKAEKSIWHKNCFRCQECNKQLNVDTYQSNDGVLYCKPHFKALFTPKAVEDEPQSMRPRKHELIIRENQPLELPPDVVRASDKPDLGLEELQNLNVKERFQVFEHHENQENSLERTPSTVNVKRSPSILSKLAKFQSKGMDIGVADDSLNGVPVEESTSEEEEEEEELEGEDAELVRARRAQREKPMHFSNMSDVMSKWESGNQMTKEERREERKQEIQSIRSRLFMGKQAKIKEMYQQAVADSSSGAHVRKTVPLDTELTESARTLRERFERGEQLTSAEQQTLTELDDAEVFESGISKKSRSIFLELDANASKPPSLQPAVSPGKAEVKRAREVFMARQASEDVVKASDQVDDVEVKTADISSRFKFFETYKEPSKQRKEFRITPPRDGKTKVPETPEEAPLPVAEPDDTTEATASHTATRMLNVFRQMEESAGKEQVPAGPKPLKRFTPPPEPQRPESGSEEEYSEEEDEEEEVEEQRAVDEDLLEAQKAARAKHLRAKFEKWEANEIKREQNNSSVNIAEEMADADSQIESAKSLCARFESMRETSSDKERTPRVKVNRFVDTTNNVESCKSCEGRVYPLEKVSCHNNVYHKNCFRCRECNTILRMDSYTYNQGLLYCLPHFKRLFIAKGNYEAGFGLDQHKEKWNAVA